MDLTFRRLEVVVAVPRGVVVRNGGVPNIPREKNGIRCHPCLSDGFEMKFNFCKLMI